MKSVVRIYKRIDANIWTEWLFRLFFTFAFIRTAMVIPGEHYPDANWLLILISVWLYFLRWRLFAFVPLFFSEFIHYAK